MSNIITSFSVPAESSAARKLMKWKKDGVNVSCRIQAILDEDTDPIEAQLEATQRKLWWIAFNLYFPNQGFSRGWDERQVTKVCGFKYTKKAVMDKAVEYDWGGHNQ